jgi:hypothetical protein
VAEKPIFSVLKPHIVGESIGHSDLDSLYQQLLK